jgi:hypothetical protein
VKAIKRWYYGFRLYLLECDLDEANQLHKNLPMAMALLRDAIRDMRTKLMSLR